MLVYGNFIPNLFSIFFTVEGVTLFPFIFMRRDVPLYLIFHERIHIRQYAELLVVVFLIIYILNYLINLIRYRNFLKAYMNICFEREAYENMHNPNYLKTRKMWAWIKFL